MGFENGSAGKRVRVALAGFGTVGEGVYQRLAAQPQRYEVAGILCRSPAAHARKIDTPSLLTDDPDALGDYDILAEAIGGVSTAGDLVIAALRDGKNVATANKTLVARRYAEIAAAANGERERFRYSAAVGGGVPMLETVDDIAAKGDIARIDAVLNGTANFILERLAEGGAFDAAVSAAQSAGFAEADPSADIDGVDAAEKLALLARRAFGVDLDPDNIEADSLADIAPAKIKAASAKGSPYKQVALLEQTCASFRAEVALRPVDGDSPLARPRREENVIVVTPADGQPVVVFGKGAGRDPTADSVFSDIERLAADFYSLRNTTVRA